LGSRGPSAKRSRLRSRSPPRALEPATQVCALCRIVQRLLPKGLAPKTRGGCRVEETDLPDTPTPFESLMVVLEYQTFVGLW
jgi:hypothetical protein